MGLVRLRPSCGYHADHCIAYQIGPHPLVHLELVLTRSKICLARLTRWVLPQLYVARYKWVIEKDCRPRMEASMNTLSVHHFVPLPLMQDHALHTFFAI